MRGNALFEPGRNCSTVALTQRHAVVIDAADYFRAARDAMLRAEEQILLICWDFDPRIKLDPDADDGDHPNRLGDFILWLARRRPQLQIHVIGRASCRERVCKYLSISVVVVSLKENN